MQRCFLLLQEVFYGAMPLFHTMDQQRVYYMMLNQWPFPFSS